MTWRRAPPCSPKNGEGGNVDFDLIKLPIEKQHVKEMNYIREFENNASLFKRVINMKCNCRKSNSIEGMISTTDF